MSELATATIEAGFQPRSTAVLDGGRVAASRHLELARPEAELPEGFAIEEANVLSLISEGNTAVQVARQLNMDKSKVTANRDGTMAKFGTHSIAFAVHKAIRNGLILIEVEPDAEIIDGLLKPDNRMLNLYARGFSNHHFAKTSHRPVKELEAYHDGLLERVGAWSRPHAVRRGHEIGIIS